MADRLTELALKIADSTAISDIECHTVGASGPDLPDPASRERYYDTTTAEPEDKPYIVDALEYLQLRGMLERHPERPELVRFKERA